MILQEAIGDRVIYPNKTPMEVDTVFDLASLTKVVATLPAFLLLLEEGKIGLDDSVTHFLPQFGQQGKENIKLRHLLTHTSGLPAHRQFYVEALSTKQIVERICAEKLVSPTGKKVIYSDLGLIIIYIVIEIVTSREFSGYTKYKIFEPLDMNDTGFNIPFEKVRYAATEYSEKDQNYKHGIVHDDNAEAMSMQDYFLQ